MTDKKKNIKRSNIIQLFLGIVIIMLVNIIAGFIFTRFDLTAEKRYSLSPATKKILKGLKDDVLFKVYLEGDLPPGFRRLANETKEMLDEMHKRKIDLADEIYVINVGGYIGSSTKNEIEYAIKTNKPVVYLENKI